MGVDAYEVRQRSDKRGVNLISDALPFGRLLVWRTKRGQATQFHPAKFYRRSHHAVIRVYDDAGNVVETHEQAGITSA